MGRIPLSVPSPLLPAPCSLASSSILIFNNHIVSPE
jgi:hypothetical protein